MLRIECKVTLVLTFEDYATPEAVESIKREATNRFSNNLSDVANDAAIDALKSLDWQGQIKSWGVETT